MLQWGFAIEYSLPYLQSFVQGSHVQLSIEALIPINKASGSRTGWIAQLHFYRDDLFPGSLGRPLLRNRD